jgi:type I restriction enzyme S subunit
MSSNWSKYRIDEIAKISMGQSPQSKFYNEDGDGLPFFQGKTEFGEYYPSVRQFTSKTTKKATKNDVLFTVRAPVGELNIANQDCCIGRGLAAIQAINKNENKFLYYILKVNTDLFLSRSSGAVYDAISGGDLKSSKVFIPNDSQERIKIAKILSNYDDLIENNLKRIKLLEESARLTYEEWFLRFRIDGKKLDIDPATNLPFGWECKKAAEVLDVNIGKTPPRGETHWFTSSGQGMKWISIKDMKRSSTYSFTSKEEITKEGVIKHNMNIAKVNTVLLSFKLTVGEVRITTDDMVTNEAIAHMNIKQDSILFNEYIYSYLKCFNFDTLGSTSSIGTAINSKIVKAMPIVIPDDDILKAFQKNITSMFSEIKNLQKQNQLLKEARDILLPRLMTGMIDTDDMDIAV